MVWLFGLFVSMPCFSALIRSVLVIIVCDDFLIRSKIALPLSRSSLAKRSSRSRVALFPVSVFIKECSVYFYYYKR